MKKIWLAIFINLIVVVILSLIYSLLPDSFIRLLFLLPTLFLYMTLIVMFIFAVLAPFVKIDHEYKKGKRRYYL
ncbi:hypothetical protein [Mammaliicoccus sciuri]|uniref:hypothetical protein n=1 Tax=Mammaliicoccus sciuri TaxID=1296 RepID=UPI001F484F1F|nr:hypothetical protein [Mammaliicoccus sciuri]MCE5086039.1 hypothetical protein [Mammaliicoccus sciuri]